MIRQVRRSEPATIVDVTPALPMVLPAVLMVGGVVTCLLSF